MAKAILFSILLATIVIPVRASSDPKPARSMKKMITNMLIFEFIWFVLLVYVYGAVAH